MSDPLRKASLLPLLLAAAGARADADLAPAAPLPRPLAPALATRAEEAPPPSADAPPVQVGPYRLLRKLGTGGMGTVHLAESGEGRRVALKVIRDERLSPDLLRRFERERRALAAVDHDFVVRLYGSGVDADGRPWLAMEPVAGEPITVYCDRRGLDVEARLRLFVEVCEAVQHLHERGVLHRDLKPANILVTERRGRPVPKIIDLGLARVRGAEGDEPGDLVGTPAYMAPECFTLAPGELDERADLFSLGIVLRELVVGVRPAGPGVARGLEEALRCLSAGNPVPSEQLASLATAPEIARRRSTRMARLRRRLRGSLDGILARASAPARAERLGSASALMVALEDDLRRHSTGRSLWRRGLVLALATAAGFLLGRLGWAA